MTARRENASTLYLFVLFHSTNFLMLCSIYHLQSLMLPFKLGANFTSLSIYLN